MALEVKTSTVEKSLIKTLSAHTQNQIHKIHTDDVYPEKKKNVVSKGKDSQVLFPLKQRLE